MILPVYHISRSIKQPVVHFKSFSIILIVRGIQIDGIAMYIRSRVCRIFGLDDRILSLYTQYTASKQWENKHSLHFNRYIR